MELSFTDTLYYVSAIMIGTPTIYFLTKSGFSFKEERKNVIISYIIAIALILLTISCIFGIDETTIKIGRLFGSLIRCMIYLIIGLIFFSIIMIIFIFLIAGNKKEVIESIRDKFLKNGKGIERRNK